MASPAEAVVGPTGRAYLRRRPERTVLHGLMREHLSSFLAERQARDRPLPGYVVDALRGLLGCGDLASGFARFRCGGCGTERLVAFTCKDRSICASCMSRRQTKIAAHLVDRVLPSVRIRQWTLSLPHRLRFLVAFDHDLCLAVHRIHWRALRTFHRRRARQLGLVPDGAELEVGAFTVVQRFGSSCELNPHFHTPMLDGVYVRTSRTTSRGDPPTFVRLPAPTEEEVSALCDTIARRIRRLLVRRGHWEDDDQGGRPADLGDEPPMADLFAASIQHRGATGPTAGHRLLRLRHAQPRPGADGQKARSHGFDLHVGRPIGAKRKDRREQLCRYLLRPALANDRLFLTPHGTVLLSIKTPWSDGTTHLDLSPTDLLARLAALVCRPRANQILHLGVLSPHHRWRDAVTPDPPRAKPSPCSAGDSGAAAPEVSAARNDTWAELMWRGLQIDALACPTCGGRFRHVEHHDPRRHPAKSSATSASNRSRPSSPPPACPTSSNSSTDLDAPRRAPRSCVASPPGDPFIRFPFQPPAPATTDFAERVV